MLFFRISTDQYFEYFLKFLSTAFVEFPALTLCPDYFEGYKLDALAAYNLTAKEVRGEFFKTSSNLTTYQVYEKVTNNLTELLTDFTIRLNTPLTNTSQVKIKYSKYPMKEKPSSKVKIMELKEEYWIRQNYNNFGRCYTFEMPIEIRQFEISYVTFTIIKHSLVFFHHPGQFFYRDSINKVPILTHTTSFLTTEHEVVYSRPRDRKRKSMYPDSFKTCSTEMNQKYDACLKETYDNLFNEKFGCSYPLLTSTINSTSKCDYGTFNEEQKQDFFEVKAKTSFEDRFVCNVPCASIATQFGIQDKQEYSNGSFHMKLYFKNNVFVRTSHVAYPFESLLAEVGGYLGLLLGVSLMDVFGLARKAWTTFRTSL